MTEGAGVIAVSSSFDPARLERLRPEWSTLFEAAGAPNPFLSHQWLFPWWRHFGARRPLWILEARHRSGGLLGILLLSARPALLGVRRWQLLGNGISGADGLDLLVHAEGAPAVRNALARALSAEGCRWDAVDLEDLPCGSPSIAALEAAMAPRGVRTQVERRFACPAFALRGTFEEHLARIRRRETYLRRVRWFARQPGFRIEVATSPDEAGPAMEDFLRLHRLRWAAEGGSYGIPPGSAAEAFHRDVAPLLAAAGWLRLYRLFAGQDAVAAVYGIEVGRRFYFYQSGYDPAWSARSPGLVLVGRTIEDAYARGVKDYDFLRGREPYKLDWTADRRETCAVHLRAPTLRAGTAAAAEGAFRTARGLARAVAPERVWEALVRVRRSYDVGSGSTPQASGFRRGARAGGWESD